jgi:hypothetical protein
MTPDQIQLMRQAARTLLEHHKAGRKRDHHALKWAKNILRWPHEPKPEKTNAL